MSQSLLAGTDYLKRRQLWLWETGYSYAADDVFLYDKNFYKVLLAHTSSSIASDLSSGKIARLISKKVNATYYDIGPFTAQAGYSGNTDTLARYVALSTNEIVVGFLPTASNSDNGGWSDGGRATVRFGFALRIAKITRD
jgi:hypothetical protein